MLKLLGSLCVLGAGGAVWLSRLRASRRTLEVLRDLTGALETMDAAIRLTRAPLPRVLRRAAQGREGEAGAFFERVRAAAESGISPGDAWVSGAAELPLSDRERRALAEAGKALSGREEELCKGLLLAREELLLSLTQRRGAQAEEEKKSTVLCFSAAALVVILLA